MRTHAVGAILETLKFLRVSMRKIRSTFGLERLKERSEQDPVVR